MHRSSRAHSVNEVLEAFMFPIRSLPTATSYLITFFRNDHVDRRERKEEELYSFLLESKYFVPVRFLKCNEQIHSRSCVRQTSTRINCETYVHSRITYMHGLTHNKVNTCVRMVAI